MELFINPLRQIAVWKSPLYKGYSECIKLNKDLSFRKTIYEYEGSTQEALMHGIRNDEVTSRGWVRLHVDKLDKWKDIWPIAVKSERLELEP